MLILSWWVMRNIVAFNRFYTGLSYVNAYEVQVYWRGLFFDLHHNDPPGIDEVCNEMVVRSYYKGGVREHPY